MTGIARSSSPSIPSPPATDQAQVVEAIKTMYVALTHDDLNQFRSVAASSFYAFDGGKRFSADALVAFIKGLHATGNVYVWNVTEPEVQVHGDIAWITYINRGSIQDASGVKGMTWLESAVLRKEQGAWLIQFFHSTRVP